MECNCRDLGRHFKFQQERYSPGYYHSGVVEKDLRRLIVRNPDALRDESNMAKLLLDQLKS